MSLVREAIKSLILKGKIQHEFEIQGVKFAMEPLSTEEQLLADSMVDPDKLKEKYKADGMRTFQDTIEKFRSIAKAAFAIRSVNGVPAVDAQATFEEQFKQRVALRDDLNGLGVVAMDRLLDEYQKTIEANKVFLADIKENSGK